MSMNKFLEELLTVWQQFEETRLNNPFYISRFYGEFDLTDGSMQMQGNARDLHEAEDLTDWYLVETRDNKPIYAPRITHISTTTPSIRPKRPLKVTRSEYWLFLNGQGMIWSLSNSALKVTVDWDRQLIDIRLNRVSRGTLWAYNVLRRYWADPTSVSPQDKSFVNGWTLFDAATFNGWNIRFE